MAKKTTVTYTCDLCEKDMGENARQRIPLDRGAVCHLCTACAHTHLSLIEKLGALIRAQPTPEQQMWGQLAQGYSTRGPV